jgi:RNA methyltransferase, TrmH family
VITSVENARVKDVLRLRKARERRAVGLFVAEGVREVERALRARLVARALYVAPELLPDWAPPAQPPPAAPRALPPALPPLALPTPPSPPAPSPAPALQNLVPEEVSARVLAKMAYRAEPEGVLGIFEIPQRTLPPGADLILVAVDIEKPGNLGAMARTADAAGAGALLVAGTASDPWNPNAIRASTGAVFTLPIVDATLDEVRALTLHKVAAVVGAAKTYTAADLTQPTALIVGAEDEGLDARWREAADMHVSIPMRARTADSLNAATSAALLLYEAVRQRG